MQRKSFVITAAIIAGLVLGVVVGPAVRGIASAQNPSPSPSASASSSASPVNTLPDLFLDKLAAALNIDRTALNNAIVSAGNATADEAVANGTLTPQQADRLRERVAAGEWGFGGGRGHRDGFGGKGGKGGARIGIDRDALFGAAAQALNLSTDELQTQLRSGQTLAQIAGAQGVTEQAVTDAVVAAAKTQLDQAVANGTITQTQADAIYARLQEQGAQFLFRGGRGFGKHDGFGPGVSPDASPSASPSPSTAPNA